MMKLYEKNFFPHIIYSHKEFIYVREISNSFLENVVIFTSTLDVNFNLYSTKTFSSFYLYRCRTSKEGNLDSPEMESNDGDAWSNGSSHRVNEIYCQKLQHHIDLSLYFNLRH